MNRVVFLLLFAFTLPFGLLNAGGIVTNTNQSASFIRNPAQDAVIGPESTYYNPAGTALLDDGFHLSINNQVILQTRIIESTNPLLARQRFEGGVTAPVFPTLYAVYKRDKLALSLGVNPIGGGGSATFENGLPSFEQQVAVLPALLTANGIPTTQYSYETHFEGTSLNWGFQLNGAYKISEMFSVSLGLRYIMANNSYQGYIRDIQINPAMPALGLNGSSMVSAPIFFTQMAGLFGQLSGVSSSLMTLVNGGGGGLTLAQAQSAGHLTAASVASISGGFAMINPAVNPATLTIAQLQGAYAAATPTFQAQQAAMANYATRTANKAVDASQSGSSIIPIVGVNIKLNEQLNIGLKYEHLAAITLKNETTIDDVGLYPDGAESPSDMPAMISIGATYKPVNRLALSGGVHYFLDLDANFGRKINNLPVPNSAVIDRNFWEAAFGVEYNINDRLLISGGYLRTKTGVNMNYQSDLSHSLSTNNIGMGGRYMLTSNIGMNFGLLYSTYNQEIRIFPAIPPTPEFIEKYDRENTVIALGFDIKF